MRTASVLLFQLIGCSLLLPSSVLAQHYGWPYCYGDRQPDWLSFTEPPEGEKGEYCENKTVGPVMTFDAHASVINLLFYNGEQFPSEYRNDAFITLRRSANRKDPKGYKIVRVNFENGEPKQAEDFLTGFLSEDGKSQFGRPAGLAIAKDGSLLLSEDANGVIYKISHK
jgi:glucose/arabinose dehydrogenase